MALPMRMAGKFEQPQAILIVMDTQIVEAEPCPVIEEEENQKETVTPEPVIEEEPEKPLEPIKEPEEEIPCIPEEEPQEEPEEEEEEPPEPVEEDILPQPETIEFKPPPAPSRPPAQHEPKETSRPPEPPQISKAKVVEAPPNRNVARSVPEVKFGSGLGPRFRRKVLPKYPDRAKRLGKEGRVLLRLSIDANGRLNHVEVLKHDGFGFDKEAVRAVKQSTYRPAMQSGRPVACRAMLPIRFTLRR